MEDFPDGFPRLSCFLARADALMITRRCGTIYSRLLLFKQDEMSAMEGILSRMDKKDAADGNERYLRSHTLDAHRASRPSAWADSRVKFLENMERKALEYGELYAIPSNPILIILLFERSSSSKRSSSMHLSGHRTETTKVSFM